MRSGFKIIVYSSKNIEKWRAKIEKTPHLIKEQAAIAKREHDQSYALQPVINSLNDQISSLDTQIRTREHQLRMEQMAHDAVYHHHDHHHHHHHHHETDSLHAVGDILSAIIPDPILSDLRSQQARIEGERNTIQSQQSKHQRAASEAECEIRRLESHKSTLIKRIPKAEKFLEALRSGPQPLVKDLADYIDNVIEKYDQDHPDKTTSVRRCIMDFKLKTQSIYESTMLTSDNIMFFGLLKDDRNRKEWQLKYLLLCGLLWDFRNFLLELKVPLNDPFYQVLTGLIQSTHIGEKAANPEEYPEMGDLPDQFRIGKNYQYLFQDFSALQPTMSRASLKDLQTKEKSTFERYMSILDDESKTSDDLNHRGARTLVTALRSDVRGWEREHIKNPSLPPPRYDLYNRALENERIILTTDNPGQYIEATKQLAQVADCMKGKPDTSKKAWGAVLGCFGAALVIGVGLVAAATFAPCPPLSALALLTSIALAEQLLVIGGLGSVGLIMAGGGLGLFASGMRHTPSSEVKACENAAEHERPAAFVM